MPPKFTVKLTFSTLAAVAVTAPAFGAGQPTNQVRPVRHPTVTPGTPRSTSTIAGIAVSGEAKNEAPFTARYSADPGYASALRKAVRMAVA